MRVKEHIPSMMGSLDAMMKESTRTVTSNIPMCPPPCSCADCQTYYYSLTEQEFDRYHYTDVLADAKAKSTLKEYTRVIFSCQEYLRGAIQKHGDHIYDRWRKRNQQKRTDILQAAEPGLPQLKGHMAEAEYFGKGWVHHRKQPAFRKYLLLPYLDIETLTKDSVALIGLINTRARDLPAEWAPYDHEQLRSPWGLGLLDVSFNTGAVVMFGPQYGTYTVWERDAAHRFDIIGFPRGKLLLEAQMTLMTFLRRVVEQLAVGIQEEDATFVGASRWNLAVSTGLKMNGNAAASSKFVHTPFLGPPRFSVDALVDLTKARVACTGDHLWLLQTEAAYLKRYMWNLSQMHSVGNVRQKELALIILNGEVLGDIDRHWFWRSALLELENLQAIYNRYRDSVVPGQPLPRKFDDALGALELVLVNAIHDRSKEIQAIIAQRPGFQGNYVHDNDVRKTASNSYEVNFAPREFGPTEHEGNANVYRMDRLWWILMQLQGEPDSQTRFRYPMLLDMLDQHLATCGTVEAARLDEILYDRFSDYTALLELLWSVRLHCPRNAIRTVFDSRKTEDRIMWRAAEGAQILYIPDTRAIVKALKVFQLSKAPTGPRTREWLQQFNKMHVSMQNYWNKLSTAYRRQYEKNGLSPADVEFSMSPLYAWQDPTYIARLATKQAQIEADIQDINDSSNNDMFLPLPHASQVTPDAVVFQHTNPKLKTRGVSQPDYSRPTSELPLISAASVRTISLSKNPLKTLRCMFPANAEERQKNIPWSVLVASMEAAGFTARNSGGSLVKFEDRRGAGSIVFHRPHPEAVVDTVMLQAMGYRMNKWFGWVRETFVLAKK